MYPLGVETIDSLLDALGHGCLRRLGAETIHHTLQSFDFLCLLGGHFCRTGFVGFASTQILRIRSAVLHDVAGVCLGRTIQMQDTRNGFVEQLQVVADHEECTLVIAQELEHPHLCIDIEVVGGFVQEQSFASAVQDATEFHSPTLATRQHTQLEIETIGLQAQSGGDCSRFTVGCIPAFAFEVVLGLGELRNVLFVRAFLHGDAQLLHADDVVIDSA